MVRNSFMGFINYHPVSDQIKSDMIKNPGIVGMLFLLLFAAGPMQAQNEKKALKKAEEALGYDEFKSAARYLKEAVGYNSKNAQSQYLLGYALYRTYAKKEALHAFEKAYSLNPGVDPDLYYYYAKCLHYSLDFDKALTFYQKARTQYNPRNPKYAEVNRSMGHCEYAKRAVQNPIQAKIINVGPPVNTQYSEHSPVISADESVMIYTTVRPDNIGCKGDPECILEDIYIAYNENDKWVKPGPISDNVNTKNFDASISLSPDGQKLYIYKNPPGYGDIFTSELEGNKWSKPESMGEPVNSKFYETTVTATPDGRMIIFTSSREGGYGDTDIYMSKLDYEGNWSEPQNLGNKINTRYSDDSPFLHPDGKTLYFSSDGRPDCMGGYDIYKSILQDDGSWSTPVNIGYPINTPDDDIYFVLSADNYHGYYASAKEGGYGEKDIYLIDLTPPVVVVKEDTVVETKPVEVKNTLTILKGTVTDAKTQEPLGAPIKVIDNEKNLVIATFKSNSSSGKYLISLPSGKNYRIEVDREDYLFQSLNVNVPSSDGYQEIVRDVALQQIEVGVAIVLNNIFYDYDKATLRPESKSELDRLFKLMEDNPRLRIELGGHTDSDGSEDYNQKLSEDRAKSVVSYLIDKGISKPRLVAFGYGESQPIDTNDTDEGKQNNRRTEFKILEK